MINNERRPREMDAVVVIGLKFVSLQDDKQQPIFVLRMHLGCDWIKIRIFAR